MELPGLKLWRPGLSPLRRKSQLSLGTSLPTQAGLWGFKSVKLHPLLTFCKPSGRARYSAAGRSGGGGSHLNSQLCSFAHNPHSIFLQPKVPDSITSQAFPVTAPRSHLLPFWFLEAPFSFETSFSSTTPTPLRPFLLLHHPIHDPTWPAWGPPPQISPTGQPTRTVPQPWFFTLGSVTRISRHQLPAFSRHQDNERFLTSEADHRQAPALSLCLHVPATRPFLHPALAFNSPLPATQDSRRILAPRPKIWLPHLLRLCPAFR